MGHASKYEVRARRNSAGEFALAEDGGVLPPRFARMTAKFEDEARGHFMVGVVPDTISGSAVLTSKGHKVIPPFNYTKQLVIGVKEFEKEIVAEERRVLPMTKKFGGVGKGYRDVPGALDLDENGVPKWKAAIIKTINMRSKNAKRCVTDLIDYTIIGAKKMYDGTPMQDKWMCYADAMAAWGEKEAQDHLAKKWPDYAARFIRPVGLSRTGTTLKHVGPPGNSPENARGTDSFGFAKLEAAMAFNMSLSSVYPYGDPRRIFSQGTPKEVWHLMSETWEYCAPSIESIVKDFEGWPRVAEKIAAAGGAWVHDECFRSGRRVIRTDHKFGEGAIRKTKLAKRDRKSTIDKELIVHPALKEAEDILLGV
jgi:hypothetical protein